MQSADLDFNLSSIAPAPAHSVIGITPAPTLRWNFWYQWRAVISGTSLISCMALTILSPPNFAKGSWPDISARGLGWLCFLTAIAIRLWASLYLGGRKGRAVVCDGPYSMCRNPLYIGTLLVILSQVFFFESATLAVGLILPMLIYMFGVVPAEEFYLGQKLGDEYRTYCAQVPRWLPRFGQFSTPPLIEVNVKGLMSECLRIANWIWLPFLVDALGLLRAQAWWPQLFNLP